MKQNRFTFSLFRKKYLINDVAGRVGNTRLDLNLKRLFLAASELHPNPDEHGTALLRTQFSGQLRGGVGGGRDVGGGKAKTDADDTGRSNAKLKIHKIYEAFAGLFSHVRQGSASTANSAMPDRNRSERRRRQRW